MRALRRHPLLVIAVALATLIGAGMWLLLRPTHYRATAEILVTPTPYWDPTYLGLGGVVRDTPGDPFRAVETAATMLDSPAAATAAAQQLGHGWDAGRVRAAVAVVPMGGTNVLAVQAHAAQATVATRGANAFAAAALAVHRETLRSQALALLAATAPSTQSRVANLRAVRDGVDPMLSLLHPAAGQPTSTLPGVRQTLTIALFVGLILGIAAALIRDAVVRRKRTPDATQSTVATLPSAPPQGWPKHLRRDDSRHA